MESELGRKANSREVQPMKICMVHNSRDLEGGKPLLSMIEENARKVLRRDTKIGFKGLKKGLIELEDFMSSYFTLLDTMDVIDRFIEAEREGYDAVTVDCFGDPGIPEAREILHIPVIGAAESTMLYACLLGRKFAVITPSHPKQIARVQHQIESALAGITIIVETIAPWKSLASSVTPPNIARAVRGPSAANPSSNRT